ncbi:hypothetical protein F5X68DRAFT_231050 [Plectosphaerella plurivora]|uniref:Uncharacterized protein n=1 Tax=Plectosphaerella plurivora TaxID=936078 RepID=A0A9P9ABS7_9PEZI|nr:hypothetical protein F5X68DRAFT_231050 [Plectosphaerella plurivora]
MILPSQIIPLILLLAEYAQAVQFVCHDGSVATCGDGTAPLLHEGLFARGDLGTRSICAQSCNVFRNKCAVTAPTCIYPNPQVPNPRAACACRPGFKADNVADGDTTKHWRVPVTGQEHRVWVAEGVSCNTQCGGYGAQSCMEVTMVGADCVGDVVPGKKYPGMVYPGGGPADYNAPPFGKNMSTTRYASSGSPAKETDVPGGQKGIPTDLPGFPDLGHLGDSSDTIVDSSTDMEPTESLDSDSFEPTSSTPSTESENTETSTDTDSDVDMPTSLPQPTDDASFNANLFPDVPLPTGEASKSKDLPEYLTQGGDKGAPAIDLTPFEVPTKRSKPHRRDNLADIRAAGAQQAWTILIDKWNWYMNKMSGPHKEFKMDERPNQCNIIRDAVVDACKNALNTEDTNCSLGPDGKDPRCTSDHPTGCCEAQRKQTYWCQGRWSTENFNLAIRDMRYSCNIQTAGGRDALKLGVYRRLLTPLHNIMKEANPPPPFLQRAAETQQKWLLWERELRYLVGGDAYRGINGLIEITGKISTGDKGYNGVLWSEAIEEPLSQNLDAFMLEAIALAFDVFAIGNERDFLALLNEGTVPPRDDIEGVRNWADEFVSKRIDVFLPSSPGRFDWQKSQADVDATVSSYGTFLDVSSFPDLARAYAVVVRADRVIGSK